VLTTRRPAGTARRRLVTGSALLLLATAGGVLTAPVAASAQSGSCTPGQTNCGVGGGGSDNGGGGTGGDNGGDSEGGGGGVYDDVLGWLNPADGCYYKVAEPQSANVPEGQVEYARSCPGPPPTFDTVVLPAQPDGFDPPEPEEVAWELWREIERRRPIAETAPANGEGLVGLPVWLWISRTGDDYRNTWGELSDEDTVRGVTVSIQGNVDRIEWRMGDTTVVCRKGEDQPYDESKAGQPVPCGHPGFQQPGTYQVEATAYWVVTWQSGTAKDGFTDPLTADPFEIEIDELQVVTE
jgi:hypothetical protein